MCKKNWFCSFQKEKFLSLRSISSHALTIIQRLSQCLPSPESPGFLNCCSLPGSPRRLSVMMMLPFLPSLEVSLIVSPFLGAPRRLSFTMPPFLPGDQPWSLTLSCGYSWWVGLSLQWVQLVLDHPESRNTGRKENPEYRQVACLLVCLRVPSLQPCQATSPAAQGAGVVGISLGPPEMLQKPVLKKPSTTLGELENSGLLRQRAQRS